MSAPPANARLISRANKMANLLREFLEVTSQDASSDTTALARRAESLLAQIEGER